jgi:hypothetical protein
MTAGRGRFRTQRGAVLIHVAFALMGLMAFSALAVDYGVLWASRRQAQNSADAAALAGAVSMALHPLEFERARESAAAVGVANTVWGQAPDILPASDVTFPFCLPAQDTPNLCVRVNVFRNQARANALPTFFARLVGVDEQGVRATATAQVARGNVVRCAKPWAIPDRWWDVVDTNPPIDTGAWTPDDVYERREQSGPNQGQLLDPRDAYVPANGGDPDGFGRDYSGLRPQYDTGTQVALRNGHIQAQVTADWFYPLELPPDGGGGGTPAERYRANIAQCNSLPVKVGDTIHNEGGDFTVPTQEGVAELIAQDPGAYWDNSCNCVRGSAHITSPRVVPVPVFSPEDFDAQDRSGGQVTLRIVKIVGLFVEPMQGDQLIGRIMPIPAEYELAPGGILAPDPTSFLYTVMLVR